MISHEHQCIFIHIPKCAGTSIEKAFGHFDNHKGRGGQDHRTIREIEQGFVAPGIRALKERFSRAVGIGRYKIRPGSNPNNMLVVTREQYEAYYKFTFVRNPWARAYSWYKNIMRDEIHRRNYKITGDLSLRDFLREQVGKRSLRPQTDWLESMDGSIKLDYIGRFETLHEDMAKICSAMNISVPDLPHEVKGTSDGYAAHYDEESIAIISDTYRREIELFDYTFDSPFQTR